MTLTQYDAGAAGLWVGLSDHRPVITAYSSLTAKGMRPRFTHTYSQARSLHLPRFRPSVKQLQDFHGEVEANCVRLEGVPTPCHHAEAQLSHLTDISLAASPSRKKWKITHAWESTVRSLTFPNGTPPEVWGTGLTPAEWRTQDVSNLHSLRLAALSTFKLLKSHLHAHKCKELSIRVSVHIASRKENILVSGLIVQRITSSLQKHGSLSLNQHAYLPKRGTDTANLQLLNTLGTAWDEQRSLYGCSWDMKKAFDSVSKPLILLGWQRLRVPLEIAQWLVDLDEAGFTIVRSPFALLERTHPLLLRKPDGSTYTARDICFADDLQSFGATLEGLQRTADLVSTYAMVFNLSIASHKLRAFLFRGLLQPPLEPLYILVYDPGWVPQRV
eukprot:gene1815-biopygen1957